MFHLIPKSMKKEVNIVIGNHGLSAFRTQCVNIVGSSDNLVKFAFAVCPSFCLVKYKFEIVELWFYRGVMIFRDCDDNLSYCVPEFFLGVCRYSSLQNAKSAISRFMNKKGGAK